MGLFAPARSITQSRSNATPDANPDSLSIADVNTKVINHGCNSRDVEEAELAALFSAYMIVPAETS